ncbi:MAG TPA: hypothetical protein VK149_12560 [Sideroxyarcus sp.]|nr:hypothetical protein [Sideroxyarcus sp.]
MSAAGTVAARVAKGIPTPVYVYGTIALLGIGLFWWLTRGGAQTVGKGAAHIVTGAAQGVITGAANDLLGVPYTDAMKCEAACASGNTLDASLYCDIGRMARYVVTGK